MLGVAALTDGSMKTSPVIFPIRRVFNHFGVKPVPLGRAFHFPSEEAGIFVNCLQSVCCMCAEPDLDDTTYILLFLLLLVCESR